MAEATGLSRQLRVTGVPLFLITKYDFPFSFAFSFSCFAFSSLFSDAFSCSFVSLSLVFLVHEFHCYVCLSFSRDDKAVKLSGAQDPATFSSAFTQLLKA